MAGTAGKQPDRRPIRRAFQPAGESFDGLLSGLRQFAGTRVILQGRLRGKHIQLADLGKQAGDPLEGCPEPERLLRRKT